MSDRTSRLNSALSGRYHIERQLGEGGMATVYLADDVRHDRKVALKVLKPELAAVVGAERFLAEIKTTANLQHPHILPLFDSGEADGFLFYVMPYVEGESLRDRLDREGELPVDQAVRTAIDVAEALHAAHEQGVVHRDIKPANILLSRGRPLVADFGIALAVSAAGGGRLTETGLSMGTPYYMSPEQASADRDPSAASDVYSLGCVLYEMLVGEPPHTGSSAQAVLAKILTADVPDPRGRRPSIPAHVDAAIRKALEKLPADRFQGTDGLASALRNPGFRHGGHDTVEAAVESGPWKTATLALAALTVLLATGLVWSFASRLPPPASYDVGLPIENPMSLGLSRAFRTSPTGDFLVYNSVSDSVAQLWYRDFHTGEARPIRGTEGSSWTPLVSPDGSQVAFSVVQGNRFEIRAVPVEGGESRLIAESTTGAGDVLEWLPDGEILLGEDDGRELRWVHVTEGERRVARTPYCINPHVIEASGRALCGGGGSRYATVVQPGDTTESRLLRRRDGEGEALRGADFRLVDGEYLVYVSVEGDLRATLVDLDAYTVGRSVSLVSGLHYQSYSGGGDYDIADNGTLLYASAPPRMIGRLVRAAGDGAATPLPTPPAAFLRWDLSPDGNRLVAVQEGLRGQELHVYDLASGQGTSWLDGTFIGHPRWSPDGTRVLVSVRSDPGGNAALVIGPPGSLTPPDTLASLGVSIGTFFDDSLVIADDGGGSAGTGFRLDLRMDPIVVDTIAEVMFAPELSPDGRWLTYQGLGGSVMEAWPGRQRRYRIPGVLSEIQWLSQTEFAAWVPGDLGGATWSTFEVDADADPPTAAPRLWFEDRAFADTPGASYAAGHARTLIYLRGTDRTTAHYVRVVPGWVDRMKRAVDEANR